VLATPEGQRSQFSKLDQLYLLIMDQVPKDTLPLTLLVLCGNYFTEARTILLLSSILGIPEQDVRSSVCGLHPVVEVKGEQNQSLTFAHTSFTDFLVAMDRSSAEYCIKIRDLCTQLYFGCIGAALRASPALHIRRIGISRHISKSLS
jgi:hypothetical protein